MYRWLLQGLRSIVDLGCCGVRRAREPTHPAPTETVQLYRRFSGSRVVLQTQHVAFMSVPNCLPRDLVDSDERSHCPHGHLKRVKLVPLQVPVRQTPLF
jgi:hypothetical protein